MRKLSDIEFSLLPDQIEALEHIINAGHASYVEEFELLELKHLLQYNVRRRAFESKFTLIKGLKVA